MESRDCILVKDLSKKYSGSNEYALNGLSISIREGEIYGFLGPNGAGKTTFFSILSGLIPATSGEASICGLDIKKELEEIKRTIGVVPQDIALYPTLSGRDNLMFIGRMYGLKGHHLRQRVDDLLTLMGFSENRNKSVKTYSGGMKRRINLLGGILHKPKVLLLDEPTVGVDVQTRISIMQHLKELNQNENLTILYTSHDLELAQNFCNHIAIVDKGNILRKGTPDELMLHEKEQSLENVFIKLTGRKIRD